ncbi:MAG TPA: hypothetical protein GX702_15650 [Chloroflexi bacterium]|nr:hypothetical protein [Chloroflexota bacterium]
MRTKSLRVLLMLVALALLIAGCRPQAPEQPTDLPDDPPATSEEAPADDQPTMVPEDVDDPDVEGEEAEETEDVETEPVDDADDTIEFGELSALESLDSYRMAMNVSWEAGGEADSWDLLVEYVRDPPATRTVLTGDWATEIIQMDGTSYMKMGDTWMSIDNSQVLDMDPTSGIEQPELPADAELSCEKGTTEQNGLQTRYCTYRWERSGADDKMADWLGIPGIEKYEVEVWLSTEYETPVKSIIHWEGHTIDSEEGWFTYTIEQNLTDVNADIVIEAPEGVGASSIPDDIPIADDATELTTMGGMIMYKTAMTLDETVEFFKENMAAEGWSLDSDMAPEMMEFSKDSRKVTLVLGESGDMTDVTLMIEE